LCRVSVLGSPSPFPTKTQGAAKAQALLAQ